MSQAPLSEITLPQFWMGRDTKYPADWSAAIQASGLVTVEKANQLLQRMLADGVVPARDVTTQSAVASGWRPPAINSTTSNAAAKSKHQLGQALDMRDDPHQRNLCRWALAHEDVLAELGLWCERPQWTPTWLHIQTVQYGSWHATKSRFFIPGSAPAMVAALPGEA